MVSFICCVTSPTGWLDEQAVASVDKKQVSSLKTDRGTFEHFNVPVDITSDPPPSINTDSGMGCVRCFKYKTNYKSIEEEM